VKGVDMGTRREKGSKEEGIAALRRLQGDEEKVD